MTESDELDFISTLLDLQLEHGEDLLNPEKCKNLLKHYKDEIIKYEELISLDNMESPIAQIVCKMDKFITRTDTAVEKSRECISGMEVEMNHMDEMQKTIAEYQYKEKEMETMLQYFRVLKRVDELNVELQKEFANNDDERCVTVFVNIAEIGRNLENSAAQNLRNFVKENLMHWHYLLRETFFKDFEELLKLIKWPFSNANFNLQAPSQVHIHKLQILSEYLLQIEIPEEVGIVPSDPMDLNALSLPMDFLVTPLRKRFLYHFSGSRQTNRIDKPEWYFTQVLTWIRDHTDFVVHWIQPVANKIGLHHIDMRLELMRGLLCLAVEKLTSDLPTLQYDDFTFSHTVDEALAFDRELRENYNYPPNQPSILNVLTQAHMFMKWLTMEKTYASEKMDVILSSVTDALYPISNAASDTHVDDTNAIDAGAETVLVTACADQFVALLQTITDRYAGLPQPGHRLQFLRLQLELLDEMRVRLIQLLNHELENCAGVTISGGGGGASSATAVLTTAASAVGSTVVGTVITTSLVENSVVETHVPMIANTVYYVQGVLTDWGTMLHFLNLYYYDDKLISAAAEKTKVSLSNNKNDDEGAIPAFEFETETVFGETLSLYDRLRKETLNLLAKSVLRETKSKMYEYRHEKWSTMKVSKDKRWLSVTPSACPIFEVLARRLHQLQRALSSTLFTETWRYIAREFDALLLNRVVLDNRFSEGGAIQLRNDVTRYLHALFSPYTERPETYFMQVNEACNLLFCAKGTALLLRNDLIALEGATGIEDQRPNMLKEIGVIHFNTQEALDVLNQRLDITSNRIIID